MEYVIYSTTSINHKGHNCYHLLRTHARHNSKYFPHTIPFNLKIRLQVGNVLSYFMPTETKDQVTLKVAELRL